MAALTPTTVGVENSGSITWIRAAFTNVVSGDTWASGITSIFTYFGSNHMVPGSQGKEGMNITQSTGTFTFYLPETSTSLSISVLCKQA